MVYYLFWDMMADDVLSVLGCGGEVCTICFGMWWGGSTTCLRYDGR